MNPVCTIAFALIACLGDSNTAPLGVPGNKGAPSWCELMERDTQNCAWGAATAADIGNPFGTPNGHRQLEAADARTAVIAFGTNGLGFAMRSPETVVADILELQHEADDLGFVAYVATVPPRRDGLDIGEAETTNAILATRIEPDRLIDFYSGMEQHLRPDGIHFRPAGQMLRAERALAVVPEPSAWLAGLAALLVLGVLRRNA